MLSSVGCVDAGLRNDEKGEKVDGCREAFRGDPFPVGNAEEKEKRSGETMDASHVSRELEFDPSDEGGVEKQDDEEQVSRK